MLKTLQWTVLLIAGLNLIGCAKLLTVEESAPEVNISSEIGAVSIAVLDQRPYVLDKDKPAAFEGIIRSSLGIPYSYNTATQEPMATFIGTRIEHGFKDRGIDATLHLTELETQLPDLIDELGQDGKKSLVISLNEWKYDFHAFSDSSWYDVDIIILDPAGKKLVSKNFTGENDIPDSGAIMNEMQLIYKARFEEVFSSPDIVDALTH
ncbi:hypothetical protein L4D20_06250 [Vibrio kyushuensis]|uniref:hypothetical protein n=1 Tax=Vibrio TaxID=662 RepID=UPI003D153362